MCHFWFFPDFSFFFSVQKFNYDVAGCDFFFLRLCDLGFPQLLEFIGLCFLPNLGCFQTLHLQILFSPTFILLSFWALMIQILALVIVYRSLWVCSFFSILFFLCCSDWANSWCPQVHWFTSVISATESIQWVIYFGYHVSQFFNFHFLFCYFNLFAELFYFSIFSIYLRRVNSYLLNYFYDWLL